MKIILNVLIIFVFLTSLFLSQSFAATAYIQVFTEAKNADIYINGNYKGMDSVKVKVEPGEHYVKVILNNKVVFGEMVFVEADITKRVLVKLAPTTSATAASVTKKPDEQLKQFGVGTIIGWPFWGLGVRYWPSREIGIEGLTFISSSSTALLAGRVLLKIADGDTADSYINLGFGNYRNGTIVGIFFGMEFFSFVSLELGYGSFNDPTTSTGSMSINVGMHYYFEQPTKPETKLSIKQDGDVPKRLRGLSAKQLFGGSNPPVAY